MSKITGGEQEFSMKILIFILTLFIFQPTSAFDENEYQLIDLRRRSYTQTISSTELKQTQKSADNSRLVKSSQSNQKKNSSSPTKRKKDDISDRKIKKKIEEHNDGEGEYEDEDDFKQYDHKKDIEIKNYIKNNPQTLPDF